MTSKTSGSDDGGVVAELIKANGEWSVISVDNLSEAYGEL